MCNVTGADTILFSLCKVITLNLREVQSPFETCEICSFNRNKVELRINLITCSPCLLEAHEILPRWLLSKAIVPFKLVEDNVQNFTVLTNFFFLSNSALLISHSLNTYALIIFLNEAALIRSLALHKHG